MQKEDKYTAVIPTIGRTETLSTVITSIIMQARMADEIIVLDEAKSPVCENFAVNQALDLACLHGIHVKIIRSRRRKGIGAARVALAEEARNPYVLMVDDDVVLYPGCVKKLFDKKCWANKNSWVVPTCILVSAAIEVDGYIDEVVDIDDPKVVQWIEKYEWFVPYFMYSQEILREVAVAGTQAILLKREVFLEKASVISELGNLPREDTVMTKLMGPGMFTSKAVCAHFEHPSQVDRGNWNSSMFYRIHDAVQRDPEGFVKFIKRG